MLQQQMHDMDLLNLLFLPFFQEQLLKQYLTDKLFIQKCRFYKILKEYSFGLINRNDIRVMISQIIMHERSRTSEIDTLNDIIYCEEKNLRDTYPISYVENDLRLKKLLIKCGYMIYNDDVLKIGERNYEIGRAVKKFCEFVRV